MNFSLWGYVKKRDYDDTSTGLEKSNNVSHYLTAYIDILLFAPDFLHTRTQFTQPTLDRKIMNDILLTTLIPIALLLVMVWGNKKTKKLENFFSKDYTTALKAAACIIVILVHVPLEHRNPMQDGIGSFAFICVTIFFMVSAYGMHFSAERKSTYLKTFWRNRLVALLIPALAINVVNSLYGIVNNCEWGGNL